MTGKSTNHELGKILKRQRLMIPMTLRALAESTGISPSHLGRIERGERYPSASVLRKLAQPLGFDEAELFTLAGYLSSLPSEARAEAPRSGIGGLDPGVAGILGQEPVEIQRAVLGILSILKSLAKTIK